MESEDYPFFQGLVFLLENDVSSLGYELTFSTEVRTFSLKKYTFSICFTYTFISKLHHMIVEFNCQN